MLRDTWRKRADAVGAGSPLGGLGEQTVAFNDGVSDWTEFSMDSAIARMVRKADHRFSTFQPFNFST